MIRSICLGLMLCSLTLLAGCGNKPRFEGTWKLADFEQQGWARADLVIKPDATFQTIFQLAGVKQRTATTWGTWKKLSAKKVALHNVKLKDTPAENVIGELLDADTLEITVEEEKHKYFRQK